MLRDAQFMTAREKEPVLRDWKAFLSRGLRKKQFTKRLYEHLHLHCGFIAHYDLDQFYSTYFEAGQDTERFFSRFMGCSAQNYGANAYYDDLNTAMRQEYGKYEDAIARQAEDDIRRRIELLEACVLRAKADRDFARQFLRRSSLQKTKGADL